MHVLTKRANEQFIILKNDEPIGAFVPMEVFKKIEKLEITMNTEK